MNTSTWNNAKAKIEKNDQLIAEINIQARTIVTQAAEIERLKAFVVKFADNWKTCEYCNDDDNIDEPCSHCHDTRKNILSIGVLYVELPEDANTLLAELAEKGESK